MFGLKKLYRSTETVRAKMLTPEEIEHRVGRYRENLMTQFRSGELGYSHMRARVTAYRDHLKDSQKR